MRQRGHEPLPQSGDHSQELAIALMKQDLPTASDDPPEAPPAKKPSRTMGPHRFDVVMCPHRLAPLMCLCGWTDFFCVRCGIDCVFYMYILVRILLNPFCNYFTYLLLGPFFSKF